MIGEVLWMLWIRKGDTSDESDNAKVPRDSDGPLSLILSAYIMP